MWGTKVEQAWEPTPVAYQKVKNESENFNGVKRTANVTRWTAVFLLLSWKRNKLYKSYEIFL